MLLENLEQNYTKNLDALSKKNPVTYDRLLQCKENNDFDFDISSNGIITITDNKKFYPVNQSLEELSTTLDTFDLLKTSPYLYFFGCSDGILLKALLNTNNHTLLIVEPKIELLFIALHCQDFSDEILLDKIYFFLLDELNFSFLASFFNQEKFIYYVKNYTLNCISSYYEKYFSEDIIKLNELILKSMEFIITNSGNDVVDSLTGLQNHILNLSRMISGPQFQEFIKHKNSDVVIMVSTGPSLTKQLPLLRSIQDHVTIICADSALRVLYLNGITADICTSMERDDLIYKLFEDIPYEYRKKIIFLRASLQNPSMFSITDGCTDILVMRPFGYNRSFKLDQYGYVCGGMSVANMSHELIALMNFKACIIIGQDLAYGADGSTHSKGYTFGETFNAVYEETGQKIISLPAYGGTGTVNSNMVWEMFLNGLRHSVAVSKDTFPTINATEGGAHIEGTLELSFLDAIEQYVDKTFKKTPIKAIYTIPEEIKRLTLEAYTTLDSIITEGESLQQLIEATFISIAEPCKKLENKTIDQQLKEFSDSDIIRMLDGIEKMRDTLMKNNTYNAFYWDLIQPIAIHHEIGLATIKTMPVSNPEENKHKAILWIFNHIPYFYTLAGSINNIVHIIRENKEKSMKN